MDGNTAKVDDALHVLESPERRRILAHLDDESVEWTTVGELASHLTDSSPEPRTTEERSGQTLEARLHHVHLPKLDDLGIVEYDPRSNAIRYRSDGRVEELLACLPNDC